MRIDYSNIAKEQNKLEFTLRYLFNTIRTWILFSIVFPWVKYSGFVRVMKGTSFARRKITINNNVQFGLGVLISTDVYFHEDILIASNASFVGRHDHRYDIAGRTMWNSPRGEDDLIIVESDVWIGTNATILAGVTIGKGSIVSAGSVVTKSIPPCEIWGGVPARKIKDRFSTDSDKLVHLAFLDRFGKDKSSI